MEYAILDELYNKSEERKDEYMNATNTFFVSKLEEIEEPFQGSSDTIHFYVFSNYVSPTGLMNLAIIIREVATNTKSSGGLAINNVECAIFPLYNSREDAFVLPNSEPEPNLHPETIKFILEKRSLPKKPLNVDMDKNKYRWNINDIASELHVSNRLIAQYCRVKNI